MTNEYVIYFSRFVLCLLIAPLLAGIINRVKAIMAGRHGKPLLQVYFDIGRLLHKGEVISETATWPFTLGPSVVLGSTILALALLPLAGKASPLGFTGDFILAAYMLGLGRFALMLAALDTGSSFEGMGASREAAFSALAEPAMFLAFLVLVSTNLNPGNYAGMDSGSAFTLGNMFHGQATLAWKYGHPELIIIPFVFFILLLAENSRIPVDDPNTHLELTMIHEVMILDHSGPNLAMLIYGATLKLCFFASLLAGLFVPPMSFWPGTGLWLLTIFLVAALVGIVESVMARLRMPNVPRLLGMAAALATLALILTRVI